MRLFLITWIGKEFGLAEVVKALKQKHEIVYWVGAHSREKISSQDFSGTIFHSHDDALKAIPAKEVGNFLFDPPSAELLEKLLGTESETLTMMSKTFENMSVNERKHLYYDYVRYWDGVVKKLKPDAIIFPNVPHSVYDFVIYGLAKFYGIKTIIFELTRVNDRCLVISDFAVGSSFLKTELKKNENKHFSVEDLPSDIHAYYDAQISFKANIRPQDIVELSEKYSGLKALKVKARSFWTTVTVLKDLSVFTKIITYLPRKFRSNQKTEYLSLAKPADLSKKFVYVPLQYQPECTTSPLGGVFVDQLLMIEILSAALPAGWLIYVKEHPLQWKPRGLDYFSYRYRGYYKAIADLPNTQIIPLETDSLTLIDKSQCVASVNGTAGWEALLRNKPSLAFGYAWYRDCPGVFKINDVRSCSIALEVIKAGLFVDSQQIISYLYSFGKISINGFREQYCKDVSPIDVTENIKNHINAINLALEKNEL